jgi:hypothetical protein
MPGVFTADRGDDGCGEGSDPHSYPELFAGRMSEILGQSVIVENVGGAGGMMMRLPGGDPRHFSWRCTISLAAALRRRVWRSNGAPETTSLRR